MKEKYIPQKNRKKILLICDDIRVHSGIAHIARETVIKSAHHFNWVNLGGAITHPDKGKRLDLSEDTNKQTGLTDSNVTLYPTDGYGNPDILRQIIELEKPDALMLIGDPRYMMWILQMENEIRKKMPIMWLNIWDELPTPAYNREMYESCDLLMGISRQTKFINANSLKGVPLVNLD